MKTIKYIFQTIICILIGSMLYAQDAVDPILKNYKIGGSSELFFSYVDGQNSYHQIMDVPTVMDKLIKVEDPHTTTSLDRNKTAAATGDFNGNGANDLVTVINKSGAAWIRVSPIREDLRIGQPSEFNLNLKITDYNRMRIFVGNFVGDPQDEFAVCYYKPGLYTVRIFKQGPDNSIDILANWNYTPAAGITFVDAAAGELDGDGIDEIVVVAALHLPRPDTGKYPPITSNSISLISLKYIPKDRSFTQKVEHFMIKKEPIEKDYYYEQGETISEMRIACGDLNNDGTDEVVVGWSHYYSWQSFQVCVSPSIFGCLKYETRYNFCNATYLHMFNLYNNKFVNYQNISLPNTYFGERKVSEGQHIGMTLKCERLDNLGKAVVLVNTCEFIYIYGADGNDMLQKIAQLNPLSGHYLNVQGNDVFAVADLNPNTTTKNFIKEIIILQSTSDLFNQLDATNKGKPSLRIASINQISQGGITFKPSGPAIPYGNNKEFVVSNFLAGDFDINDAEMFFVKSPMKIELKKFEQPIVILNSPPVHFDVLNGEIINLNNAFSGSTPEFFTATYSTSISNQQTTSIKVNKGMGLSGELKAYADIGGVGFEAGVRTNFTRDSSFFNSKTQSKAIQESMNVYWEDGVLFSKTDYDYYIYPVYNKGGEKKGDIAILNPVPGSVTSHFDRAKDWNNPSYVFNHEPGNLLSYKQKEKTLDFSNKPSGTDFKFDKYTTGTVAGSGGMIFGFDHSDISQSNENYSYSAEIGADLLIKVGIEQKVTVNMAPLGMGGSNEVNIKLGASASIAEKFNESELSTHETELKTNFKIDGKYGALTGNNKDRAKYFVTPYIYRSQSGALVLDYIVDFNMEYDSWWKEHYGKNPDLAFILPWRYDTEKGEKDVRISRKQKTNDIQFYPPVVSRGETVAITARVHNFSLMGFKDTVKVDFYIGDPGPDNKSVKLTDIYGNKRSSRFSKMVYGEDDREDYITFMWKVPDTLTCSPRIYAVIDPDNVFPEIHKTNNVGWNTLNVWDCPLCSYYERKTHTENIIAEQLSFKAYPNPFRSECQIRFSLPHPEDVQVDLYNFAGQKITTVAKGMYNSGENEVKLSSKNLSNGIYFCRIIAGTLSESIKLIVIR